MLGVRLSDRMSLICRELFYMIGGIKYVAIELDKSVYLNIQYFNICFDNIRCDLLL